MDKFANLEAFVAVVDSGSFSRAAERLDTGKSIVSRRVGTLERALGVQLLRRTTRSLSLTASGSEFHAHAVAILAALEEAEQTVSDSNEALRGPIRLAAPLSFGLHHLSDAVAAFLDRHPAIEMDLDLNDREVNLVEEGLDMTVRIGDLPDSTLVARRIGTARFVTCASPAYLERHGVPAHPEALREHTGLHYSNITPAQDWQFADMPKTSRACMPAIRFRVNNGDVLADMAAAGLGIANLPSFIASRRIASGELIPVLTGYRRAALGIHAVFPPGRIVARRLRILTDFLTARFGDHPTWDQAIGLTCKLHEGGHHY